MQRGRRKHEFYAVFDRARRPLSLTIGFAHSAPFRIPAASLLPRSALPALRAWLSPSLFPSSLFQGSWDACLIFIEFGSFRTFENLIHQIPLFSRRRFTMASRRLQIINLYIISENSLWNAIRENIINLLNFIISWAFHYGKP